jgi:hypothetical protein
MASSRHDFVDRTTSYYGEIPTPVLKSDLTIALGSRIRYFLDQLFAREAQGRPTVLADQASKLESVFLHVGVVENVVRRSEPYIYLRVPDDFSRIALGCPVGITKPVHPK